MTQAGLLDRLICKATLAALRRAKGNRTHASKALGISIRTMRNYLHKYAKEGKSIPQARTGRRK